MNGPCIWNHTSKLSRGKMECLNRSYCNVLGFFHFFCISLDCSDWSVWRSLSLTHTCCCHSAINSHSKLLVLLPLRIWVNTFFLKVYFRGKCWADCFRCLKGAVSRQSDTVLRLLSVFAWRGGRSNRQGLKSVLLEHGSGQLSVTTLSLHFLICTCTGPGDSQ